MPTHRVLPGTPGKAGRRRASGRNRHLTERRCRPAPWTPEAGPGDSGGMEERGVRLGLGRESEGMAGPGKNVDKPKKILIFF